MSDLRVKQHNVYDDHGVLEETYYTIEQRKRRFFRRWKWHWKPVTRIACSGMGDAYSVTMHFKDIDVAVEVGELIRDGKPRDETTSNVVRFIPNES